jgi:hypothetical protein
MKFDALKPEVSNDLWIHPQIPGNVIPAKRKKSQSFFDITIRNRPKKAILNIGYETK